MLVDYMLPDGPHKGEIRPAIITRHMENQICNLLVFMDGANDFPPGMFDGTNFIRWRTSAPYSGEPKEGHWSYPQTSTFEGPADPMNMVNHQLERLGMKSPNR